MRCSLVFSRPISIFCNCNVAASISSKNVFLNVKGVKPWIFSHSRVSVRQIIKGELHWSAIPKFVSRIYVEGVNGRLAIYTVTSVIPSRCLNFIKLSMAFILSDEPCLDRFHSNNLKIRTQLFIKLQQLSVAERTQLYKFLKAMKLLKQSNNR